MEEKGVKLEKLTGIGIARVCPSKEKNIYKQNRSNKLPMLLEFIIRKDIAKKFKDIIIGNHISTICFAYNVTVDYALQEINDMSS